MRYDVFTFLAGPSRARASLRYKKHIVSILDGRFHKKNGYRATTFHHIIIRCTESCCDVVESLVGNEHLVKFCWYFFLCLQIFLHISSGPDIHCTLCVCVCVCVCVEYGREGYKFVALCVYVWGWVCWRPKTSKGKYFGQNSLFLPSPSPYFFPVF